MSRSGDATYDMYVRTTPSARSTSRLLPASSGCRKTAINLLPSRFTGDTTGDLAANCSQAGKSWLDDLVVVAVKVNGDTHGTNTAVLTYTISAELPQ